MLTTCPNCGSPRAGTQRFCPTCGADYWKISEQLGAQHAAPDSTPTAGSTPPSSQPGTSASGSGAKVLGSAVLIGIIAIFWLIGSRGPGTTSDPDPDPTPREPRANITGRFLEWEPVDDARGYAYFEITNRGPEDGVAECTVSVSNEFGNFGFDILAGEPIEAGETISGRMAIDVSEGSFLIDEGEVKDC